MTLPTSTIWVLGDSLTANPEEDGAQARKSNIFPECHLRTHKTAMAPKGYGRGIRHEPAKSDC